MSFRLITIITEIECPNCLSSNIYIHVNKVAVVYECQDKNCDFEVAISHKKNMTDEMK